MPEKASLQQGKLLQQRNVPCGALAKDSNTSRFRDQPFKTAATKSARTLPTECLKQQENSCSHEMFLAERLRKTRTPAGFVTNPSKQQPQKVPERYLRNALNSRKTMFLAERLRKTRTPAGFVTNPSKQQPQKVPERYLRNALNS